MKKSIAVVGICILVVGMSFVLIHIFRDGTGGNPPINPAVGVSFTDTDPDRLEIGGNITITRAVNESDITHYVLYWGSNSSTKSGAAIIEISKTGSDIIYPIGQNTSLSVSTTHFLVYTKNDVGEMATGVNVSIVDLSSPTERLQNGNFESGNVVWVQTLGSYDVITTDGQEYSGSWSAWLGGDYDYTDALDQEVTISVNATVATLRFYRRIETSETGGTAWDFLYVRIRDPVYNWLETLVTYSNLDDTASSWIFTAFDLASYIGQTIRICFESSNDVSNITNFFIDDVSLLAND